LGESKGEGGSWLYGIILILSGGFIFLTGLLNALGISLLSDLLTSIAPELAFLAGIAGYTNMAIGVWGIIGGVGLIKDQEWRWLSLPSSPM
jgi:hypothetical protein